MNIKELNEAIAKVLCEDEDKFIPMLMDYFNVPSSDIRKATEEESMASDITYDDYYVKDKGFFEVASKEELIDVCSMRLEELEDAAEPSVVAKIFQTFIDNYGEEILLNKEITEVTADNLEEAVKNFDFKKLSEFLLSDDVEFVTEIGRWVNSYDGEVHFLGNSDGTDYYISRFNESVKQTKSSKKSMKESKDETIYVLRHPDYPSVPDIACKSQTLIKYAEERRQDYIKTDDTITKNTITDVFAAKSFLEDNGFIIQAYVLY